MTNEPSSIAVVTGGGGGIGLATAKLLGRDHFLVLCDIDQDKLDAARTELTTAGTESSTVICDITNQASVADLVRTVSALGRVAALVHTAGVSPTIGDAAAIMRVNALGSFYLNEAFLDICEEGFASVNTASMAGHLLPGFVIPRRQFRRFLHAPDATCGRLTRLCQLAPAAAQPALAYGISKNFVSWYCRRRAASFGAKGGRLLSVSPGSVDTAMGRAEEVSGSGAITQLGAIKRFATPDEIAQLLAFCVSSHAGYLTGTDILCDGGVVASARVRDLARLRRPR